MLKLVFATAILLLLPNSLYAIEPRIKIIEQTNSPIKITDYRPKYERRGNFPHNRYVGGLIRELWIWSNPPQPDDIGMEAFIQGQWHAVPERRDYESTKDGIHHYINYVNNSDRTIVAVQFGFVSFDIWNEFLDRISGATINNVSPNKTDKAFWISRNNRDFAFLTGVAYVSKVRFENGEIWSADLDVINEEIIQIQEDITQLGR